MKRYLLVAALALFLFMPMAQAFDSCTNVTVTAIEPRNLNYTSSINLPLDFTVVNASNCKLELTSAKYDENISIDCNIYTGFDVDYDGYYTLRIWAENSSSGDCNATMPFTVDRNSEFVEGKPIIMTLLIFVLVIFGFVVIAFGSLLDKKFQVLVNVLSFIFVYSAFVLVLLAAREYIKVPSIYNHLVTIYWATMIILTLLASIIIIFFITDFIKDHMKNLKDKWMGKDQK